MDAIRIARVEEVLCSKAGSTRPGTLHLTAHHLIFAHDEPGREELWIPYPLIALVTRLPQTLLGRCPLTLRTRTFDTLTLAFAAEQEAADVFDSIKDLTVATSVTQLYAFAYAPNPPFAAHDGWTIYSPREEFGRMGVGTRTKAWRFTDINKDYSFCSTYPARLVVPTRISDTTLQYASRYRSKCRIPTLTYLHWANYGSITRSSQPMVGLTQNRSIQDEKLIEAIFQTHYSPESRASHSAVYGATATNIIIDARPTTNAVANTAKGAGTENMDHYKEARKLYLGIDNIHTMRDSLARVVDALRETEIVSAAAAGDLPGESAVMPILDRQALRRSGWLRHISAIIEGSVHIIRNVHVNSSHVLIHCSDGWDRTAQLSALSQLCLDPFYRTMRGFQILVEKDWVSFGHKFLDRCGHLSSEKFFVAPVDISGNAGGAEAAQAFFASVQNRFSSQKHLQETSPVFHQFLESVRQVQRQFPERFEFNERFLRQLHYHLYSCQFGTFLFNCDRERRVGEAGLVPSEHTASVWDFFNSPPEVELNRNPDYDASLDDPLRRDSGADMGVLFPNPKDVRFWHELYGRTDEEMNGKFVTRQVVQGPDILAPVENAEEDPAVVFAAAPTPPSPSSPKLPAASASPNVSRIALQRTASPSSPLLSSSHSLPPSGTSHMTRHDSLSGLHSSSSSTSLRTHSAIQTPRSSSPSSTSLSARSPPASRPAVSDLFGGGGVRSVWGRFSSNASAALSAVQDAYEGVAKDLSKLSVAGAGAGPSGSSSEGGGGELKSRDELSSAWADDRLSTSPSPSSSPPRSTPISTSMTTSSTINPWSTTRPARTRPNVPSMLFDNPWSSPTTTPSETPSPLVNTLVDRPSRLPMDPTVEPIPPTPQRRETTRGDLGLENPPPPARSQSEVQTAAPPKEELQQPKDLATDPLGVGVW